MRLNDRTPLKRNRHAECEIEQPKNSETIGLRLGQKSVEQT